MKYIWGPITAIAVYISLLPLIGIPPVYGLIPIGVYVISYVLLKKVLDTIYPDKKESEEDSPQAERIANVIYQGLDPSNIPDGGFKETSYRFVLTNDDGKKRKYQAKIEIRLQSEPDEEE